MNSWTSLINVHTIILLGILFPVLDWGGVTQFFFSGRSVRPGFDFWNVGLANWYLPLKRGACELKISNLGACELKIPNLGACELKISQFGGFWVENFQIGGKLRLKRPTFPQKGIFWTDSCLKWDPCELREAWKGTVFRARHPHTPFLGQSPSP